MQVGSRESSPRDTRADISCKLWEVRQLELWSQQRLLLLYLYEMSACASLTLDSREQTYIVYTRLNISSVVY
jgi:hypothetical protein